MRLAATLVFFLLVPSWGADKKIEPATAGNDNVEFVATAFVGKEAVAKALGVDPGVEMIAVELRITPKEGKLVVSRDDFTMISRRDGQRSQGMHPSQIAGSGVLMVSSTAPGASGGVLGGRNRPIWGGMPGTGTRPRRIGGDDDVVSGTPGETKTAITEGKDDDNPVLAALKARELPQKEIIDATSGFVYFIFEGKHKLKDLDLMYKGPAGQLMLDFQK